MTMATPEAPPAPVPIFVTEENRTRMLAMYQRALGLRPAPFEERLVPTRYGKTYVVAGGDPASAPLLLLHPMGGEASMWPPTFLAALHARHRTYALDTIGDVGKSVLDDPARYPRNGHEYSDWLDDVYRGLGLEKADLVAGSMGGWIALNHALHAPQRVGRLALLGPMGLPSLMTTLGVLGPMLSAVLRPTDAKLERIIDRSLGDGPRAREFRPWMRVMAACKPRLGSPFHISARKLQRIVCPTLVILGGKDGLIGNARAAAARARRHIADCDVEILPDAGHVMMIDEPELVGSLVAKFLDAALS
jgi:pimeloyl-ACP methyl ester carboxylesterase